MGALKRIVDERADAGLCVLCGKPGPEVPFMSGEAHKGCALTCERDLSEWARDEAERDGGYAEVRQMETPRESRNGYSIDGDVETRSGWRAQDGRVRHFTCTVANGRVEDVFFQRERPAR